MDSHFYVFLPKWSNGTVELNSVSVSWVYTDVNNELKLAQGLLKDVVAASLNKIITVVLPGENVLSLTAEVPGKNIQRVQQAVPYVLEDSVIDDVESLYFAIQKSSTDQADNNYNVAVINKEYLESIIEQLESVGIYADVMTADYMLLGSNNQLFFDGSRVLFNSESARFASDINIAIKLIDVDSLNLVLCGTEEENNKLTNLFGNTELNLKQCETAAPLCLVNTCTQDNVVNLLQGSYKKKKDWSQTGKTWLPIAALFLIWIVFQGGLFIYDYINLSKQNKLLNAEITQIYKRTFPESRRIVDAKAQMQQKLSSLKKRKGQSGQSFSGMLSASAAIFSKTKGLSIKSLRYYDGRINIELQIASLQALDKLKEQLQNEKGYQVEIQNASSGKETVTARIQIVGAGI